jgi:hypothetical protein
VLEDTVLEGSGCRLLVGTSPILPGKGITASEEEASLVITPLD